MEFWKERREFWEREFVGRVIEEVKKKKMNRERERRERRVNVRNRDFVVVVLLFIAIFSGFALLFSFLLTSAFHSFWLWSFDSEELN